MSKKNMTTRSHKSTTSNKTRFKRISSAKLKKIIEQHKNWLKSEGKEGEKADLTHVDLSNTNLAEVDLEQAALNNANLRGANLQSAYLEGAVLSYADLTNANLQGANLFKANLHRANLQKANLKNVSLRATDLSQANLKKADLTKANLQFANLRKANLTKTIFKESILIEVDLENANLCDANIMEADFTKANLKGINLQGVNLRRSRLYQTELQKADLQGYNLTGAQLEGATLTEANLKAANLERANLKKANLTRANLNGSNIKKANLSSAILHHTDLRRSNLKQSNLEKANLIEANLKRSNLTQANLSNADLSKALFREACLQDANLTNVKGLLGEQLGGSNVSGAKLPDSILKFEGLASIEEASKNSRKSFILMLLACIYSILTIATTTDSRLLANSPTSPLPIIGTTIPIVGFYLMGPIILLAIYTYFHLNLQRLWEVLAEQPAVFPDGITLPKKVYPWLLNCLIYAQFSKLRNKRPSLIDLQLGFSFILGWWVLPALIIFFWVRYLPRHDLFGTALHVIGVVTSIVLANYLSKLANSTLRGEGKKTYKQEKSIKYLGMSRHGAFAFGIIAASMILYSFSLLAINSVPPKYVGSRQISGDFPLIKRLLPITLSFIGIRTYADFYEADVSIKPSGWKGINEEELLLVKGARLRRSNLRYVNGRRAFLLNADLRYADLRGADLSLADLRGANLLFANLQEARLSEADLREAHLFGAYLQRADLGGAKLQKTDFTAANLSGATLQGAKLQKANLSAADLSNAVLVGSDFKDAILYEVDLRGADFRFASLVGADLRKVDIRKVHNLSVGQLSEVKTLYDAQLDPKLLERIKNNYPFLLEKQKDEKQLN